MTVRSVVLVLLSVFAAIFLILNWAGITATVPVNLLFVQTQAPLGLILLVVLGVLWCVGIVWALMQQASTLVEIRKAYKEANVNKGLAEHAEQSRIQEVKESLQGEFKVLEKNLTEALRQSAENGTKLGVANDARLAALEKTIGRLTATVEKLADKVGVAPVPEVEEVVEPPKRGFLGLFSAPKHEVKAEAKVAPPAPAAEPEPLPAPAEAPAGGFKSEETKPAAESVAEEGKKKGLFKKMFH